MSSLRNIVQRRNHKERSQPQSRKKLGILEKHKDYALRAKDYRAKKGALKILQRKASERNPDEFHFAMLNARSDSRGHKIPTKSGENLSSSAMKLLKTQDAVYLQTLIQKTKLDIQRLEESSIICHSVVGSCPTHQRTKTVFAEDETELPTRPQATRDESKREIITNARRSDLAHVTVERQTRLDTWESKQMKSLLARREDLLAAIAEMDRQRAQMNGHTAELGSRTKTYRSSTRKR